MDVLPLRRRDLLAVLDDEGVLLQSDDGEPIRLTGVPALLWAMCDGRRLVQEAVSRLAVPRPQVEAAVRVLAARGLVLPLVHRDHALRRNPSP